MLKNNNDLLNDNDNIEIGGAYLTILENRGLNFLHTAHSPQKNKSCK